VISGALLALLSAGTPTNLEAVFEKVDPAVVTIRVGLKQLRESERGYEIKVDVGTGSGILLHQEGFIVTAAHVVEGAQGIMVAFRDGTQTAADVISLSRTEDLALLKVYEVPKGVKAAVLGDSEGLKVGQPVFSIGAPLGLEHTLTSGVISGVRHDSRQRGLTPGNVIQTDAALNQGNSGGPLFNEKGEVIGIASYIASLNGGNVGLGFAVPSNTVRKRLFDNALPWLGMSLRHLPLEICTLFNWPYPEVMLIERVAEGSSAEKAGLLGGTMDTLIAETPVRIGGDVIVKVGEYEAHETEKIGLVLSKLKTGDKVHYTVMRGGKLFETDVEVPKRVTVPKLPPLPGKK
jgi:S1-C subfamily serine protease